MEKIEVGDKIVLQRRYSEMNGWSIRENLDGKTVEVIEVDPCLHGFITALYEGNRLGFFRNAVGSIIKKPNKDITTNEVNQLEYEDGYAKAWNDIIEILRGERKGLPNDEAKKVVEAMYNGVADFLEKKGKEIGVLK